MTEVWVLRIVVERGRSIAPGQWADVMRKVQAGTYCMVGGDICEPVLCTDVPPGGDLEGAQRKANEHAIEEHRRTGSVHKVVLTSDV